MKQSPYQLFMGVVLLCTVTFLSWQAGSLAAAGLQFIHAENGSGEKKKYIVCVDPGHGGTDPGKVGINGQLEKDINLAIAKKLKTYLEASDVTVVLTRDKDMGLYSYGDAHKKMADMRKRCQLIEEVKPDLVISIHQNSYPEEYVHGAQVFYYNGSSGGEQLAGLIQTQLVRDLDPENHRQIKPNDSYYLLKKTKGTIVIVECGFLSNAAEAGKLCDEAYQDRVAWSIHKGILQYITGIQRD